MRRLLSVLILAGVTGACAGDAAGPADDRLDANLNEMALVAYGALHVGEPGHDVLGHLPRLPGDLALSAAQRSQIAGLVEAFLTATAADRDALAEVMRQAAEARRAGSPAEEVRAILAGATGTRARLQHAERELRAAIFAVLTPAQRAWLSGHTPQPRPCATLTEAQRNEISGLLAAFEQTNAADIRTVRTAHETARTAARSGASRREVQAILADARAAMQRLAAARQALRAAIDAVLTPEQRSAGCLR